MCETTLKKDTELALKWWTLTLHGLVERLSLFPEANGVLIIVQGCVNIRLVDDSALSLLAGKVCSLPSGRHMPRRGARRGSSANTLFHSLPGLTVAVLCRRRWDPRFLRKGPERGKRALAYGGFSSFPISF
ncbi:unnamed protein product [Ixodes pacificus]